MNPVALITGASRGIGRGIALKLATHGHDLVINYAGNQAAAEQTASECRTLADSNGHRIRALACQADIGADTDRRKLIHFARSEFNRLDLLVNNAGITSIGRDDVLEASEHNFDQLMAVNLKGPYFLTQLAANWMIEQLGADPADSGQTRPKIVTISSLSAYAVSVNRGDYCLAKAALGMLTQIYATRLAEFGINVYEIRPGIIATDMTGPVKEKYDRLIADGLTPIRRWGTPEDVAKAVAAIALDWLPFSTGECINVDGGFHIRNL